ncbi:Hypothetical predicted protein [Pelobates cultripes]|uniref:Uncharacterized protein n=1 Tax=Pelobates cultripes TaxID=61616 RepID=A0AAD1W069_PELCU|nr:Hypothetical predicted protein [Pelobates cultripes]
MAGDNTLPMLNQLLQTLILQDTAQRLNAIFSCFWAQLRDRMRAAQITQGPARTAGKRQLAAGTGKYTLGQSDMRPTHPQATEPTGAGGQKGEDPDASPTAAAAFNTTPANAHCFAKETASANRDSLHKASRQVSARPITPQLKPVKLCDQD